MKRTILQLLLAMMLLLFLGRATLAQADEPGPTVSTQVAQPGTVTAGDYSLVSLILDFQPGAGIPNHTHPGPVVVTVLEGAITLIEAGGERTVSVGETWTETSANVHSVVNKGATKCRVWAVLLVPKGADATSVVGTPQNPPPGPDVVSQVALPATLPANDYSVLGVVFDFAPGAIIPLHTHPGPVVVTVAEGTMTLRERGTERQVKTGESWTENASDIHSVINLGSTNTRVLAVLLVPQGAEPTTLVTESPAGMPRTGAPAPDNRPMGALLLGLLCLAVGAFARRDHGRI